MGQIHGANLVTCHRNKTALCGWVAIYRLLNLAPALHAVIKQICVTTPSPSTPPTVRGINNLNAKSAGDNIVLAGHGRFEFIARV